MNKLTKTEVAILNLAWETHRFYRCSVHGVYAVPINSLDSSTRCAYTRQLDSQVCTGVITPILNPKEYAAGAAPISQRETYLTGATQEPEPGPQPAEAPDPELAELAELLHPDRLSATLTAEVEEMAGLQFSAQEVAVIAGLDYAKYGEHAGFKRAMLRGRLKAEATQRAVIFAHAEAGSSPAQLLAQELILRAKVAAAGLVP